MKRILALLLLAGLPAVADISLNSYVLNPSFEVPGTTCCNFPTGWSQGGTAVGDAGNWNPSDFPVAGLLALSGQQVGYINNYSGQSGFSNYWYLAQTLSITGGMQAGTTYSLTYGVARRADLPQPAEFRVQINGNCPTCYAITSGSTGDNAVGTWHSYSVSYTAQANDLGFQPTIYLVNDGSVTGQSLAQVEFDLPVPEPAGIFLLGFQFGSVALLALVLRKVRARP